MTMTLDEEFPLDPKRKGVRILLDPVRIELNKKGPNLFYLITDGYHYVTFVVVKESYAAIKSLVEERALASLDRYVESLHVITDDELVAAKINVRCEHPLAYQDYLGHIWTDDLYNCDSHCIAVSVSINRDDMKRAWLAASKRVDEEVTSRMSRG